MKEFEGLKVPDGDILKEIKIGAICLSDSNFECPDGGCSSCIMDKPIALAKYIATHLTPIDQLYVPFGMLSEEKREELISKHNPFNMQILYDSGWIDSKTAKFYLDFVYRLDPNWTPEDPKEERRKALIKELEEIGAVVDGKVIL